MIKYKFLIFILLSLLSVSCITNKTTRYLQNIKGVNYAQADTCEYKIKVGDEINILVFTLNQQASEIFFSSSQGGISQSLSYLVYSDGKIDIPFINSIKIEGLTVEEAAKQIESKLKVYIPDAEVKICLVKNYYYIIGEGNTKGAFPLNKDKINIFEALAQGRNISLSSNRRKVKIIREVDNKITMLEFDLRSKEILDSEYYYIQPNDIIYLKRSPKGFYRLNSFSSFMSMISSSFSFVLLVISTSK